MLWELYNNRLNCEEELRDSAMARIRGLIVGIIWMATTVSALNHKYLGCYKDSENDRDINGQQMTLDPANFDFDQCSSECQKMGYPYLGIQAKSKCLCGYTYGKHGTTNTCNYTCSTNIQCGGVGSNDVFYSIKVDATSESTRQDDIYKDGLTFSEARSVCVKYEGDIKPIITPDQWTAVKSTLEADGITSGKIWQGMRKIYDNAATYAYTDRSQPAFGGSSYSNWVSGETQANPCVVINVADGTWESSSCSAQYPYICRQQPAPDVGPTAADDGSGDGATASKAFDKSKLSLYIVLPLFGFCYIGSCVLYCTHKIYKALKRKRRQKMLLSRLEDMPDGHSPHMMEYEPHNKPPPLPPNKLQQYNNMNMAHINKMNQANMGNMPPPPPMGMPPPSNAPRYEPHPKPMSVRPFSASRRAAVHPIMAPPPMQNSLFKEPSPPPKETERPVRTPVEEIKISPRGEPEGEQAKEEPESQNPQTARDVEIDIPMIVTPPPEPALPPPVISAAVVGTAAAAVEAMKPTPSPRQRDGTQSAKTKAEIRRQKLLDKAVNEARERRRKEAEASGVTPTPTPSGPPSSESPDESQWAQRPKKRNKSPKYGEDPDSGDSTVNLLSDSERVQSLDPNAMGRDPTTMSIQEILRMKVAAKQNRKRPKKPISA